MRILITVPCYWPAISYGGPVQKARSLAEELTAQGCSVTVLTSNLLDLSHRLSDRTVVREVGPVQVVYLHSPVHYRWNPVCPGAIPWCGRHLARFDVVHVMGYRESIGITAGMLARRKRIPTVFEPVGMFRRTSRNLRLKWMFDSLLGRRLARWADAVIATSTRERSELVEGGIDPDRIEVRPNGVDLSDFEPLPPRGAFRSKLGIDGGDQVVLYLGRIQRQKGLPYLAEALADVGGAHLVVAGPDYSDGARGELFEAARRWRMEDRLHYAGVLDAADKRQALADADVLALPSAGESFGNAAAEAVAARVPVLVTDRCGVAEFIEPASLVVPYERGAIGEGVRRLLRDESLRAWCAEGRDGVVDRLRWEAVAARQLDLYRSLVARTRQRQSWTSPS